MQIRGIPQARSDAPRRARRSPTLATVPRCRRSVGGARRALRVPGSSAARAGAPQTPANLHCAQVLGAFRRCIRRPPTDRESQNAPFRSLHPAPHRPQARVHELPGRPLSRRVARDCAALDRRWPYRVLQDSRRPAALLQDSARRVRRLDAAHWTGRACSGDRAVRASRLTQDSPRWRSARRRAQRRSQLARRPNFSRRRR